jgi:hypothetical protein
MLPASCDEEDAMIPGWMLLLGISDFCCCDESDKVLLSALTNAFVTCFSDDETGFGGALDG